MTSEESATESAGTAGVQRAQALSKAAIGVRRDVTVSFHPLVVRPDDDDPDTVVIGRPEVGEFLELPAAYGTVLGLLLDGLTIGATARRMVTEEGVEADVSEFVELLTEEGFVRAVGDRDLPDPAADVPRSHFRRLTGRHVGWVFSRPMKLLWVLLFVSAAVSVLADPELVPHYGDFFWTDYVGFAVLVNTAMFSVSISVHEMMHLVAARSLGSPGRVGFGTRLHNLVVQTDVTAIWGVPRRRRYRVYMAGLVWDVAFLCGLILAVAHVPLPAGVRALLEAWALTVLLCIPLQLQVFMRTDLYYVLRDLLRCRNLFDDGMAYARHLAGRVTAALRPGSGPGTDPSESLPAHARRATRIYACFMVGGSAIALVVAAFYGLPIAVRALLDALEAIGDGVAGGPVLPAVDAGLLILVEGGLQAMFVVTFLRRHHHWFRRRRFRGDLAQTAGKS